MIPTRRLWPVIAIMLSIQLEAITKIGILFATPNFFICNSIIKGTTTAGETPLITKPIVRAHE
jgi:hypothetical protein